MSAAATLPPGLALPSNQKGIGKIIHSPESPDLIQGIRIAAFPVWPDDRGFFLEVVRIGKGLAADFPTDSTQVSAALSYSGTIKAFHFHRHQTDFWVPVSGVFQVGLVDLRPESPTFGLRNTLYAGALRPWQILIPPGVAHGYKVVGPESGILVYVTNRHYDPSDEGRIPYDDPSIAYDWETQHK